MKIKQLLIVLLSLTSLIACAQNKKDGYLKIVNSEIKNQTIEYINYMKDWSVQNNYNKYLIGIIIENKGNGQTNYYLGAITKASFLDHNNLLGYDLIEKVPILIFRRDSAGTKGNTDIVKYIKANYGGRLYDDLTYRKNKIAQFKDKNKSKTVALPNFTPEGPKALKASNNGKSNGGKKVKMSDVTPVITDPQILLDLSPIAIKKITLASDIAIF